jgi:hypothetical protein
VWVILIFKIRGYRSQSSWDRDVDTMSVCVVSDQLIFDDLVQLGGGQRIGAKVHV